MRGEDCQGIDHLFRSNDLAQWEHIGALLEDKFYAERGEDQAVPVFWPLSDIDGKPSGKHMLLLFSHKRSGRCYIGDYDPDTQEFTPDSHDRMNYGPWMVGSLHAPSAAIGPDGRFTAIFNVKEGKPPAGWVDIMSLPRYYWLADDGTLGMSVAGDVESLRYDHKSVAPMAIPANDEVVLDGVGGKAVEVEAVIEPGTPARWACMCCGRRMARSGRAYRFIRRTIAVSIRARCRLTSRRGRKARMCSRGRRRLGRSSWRRTNRCGFAYSLTAVSWRCSPTTGSA